MNKIKDFSGMRTIVRNFINVRFSIQHLFTKSITNYRYQLTVCAIFNDEAKFLDEWLTFHHGVGVEHFYLYNDKSKDNYASILAPWIKKGIVTLSDWPEKNQVEAFNHCLNNNRHEADWMAFIDIDEFLFSPTGQKLPNLLENYKDAAAVFVYWALFGSSGHTSSPIQPVIESYTKCQSIQTAINDKFNHCAGDSSKYVTGWSRDGKSIIKTSRVRVMNNHQPKIVFFGGTTIDENFKKVSSARERRKSKETFSYSLLRINHYWSKSIEDLTRRSQRGDVFDRSRPKKDLKRLLERDKVLNEKDDDTILPIWKKIKEGDLIA